MKLNLKTKNQPNFISPQKATLTEKYFSDKEWIYEEKFDGIRCIVVKKMTKYLYFLEIEIS